MRRFILLAGLSWIIFPVFSQDYAGLNNSYKEIDSSKIKSLDFRIETLGFFQNNEYKGKIVDGYTLTGAWLRPKLSYTFNEKLKLEFGGHFLRYHSRDDFAVSRPWFSAQYKMSDKLSVVFGHLNQNGNHGLLKQLLEPERIMTDAPEEGLQFLYNSKYLNLQTWINWEQFILKDDPFQEHFTIGISGHAKLVSNSNIKVKVPLQFLAYHKGGEIDSSPLDVVTHYNYASGLELAINTNHQFFKTIDLNAYWLRYKCPDGPAPLKFDEGHAFSIVASTETPWGHFSVDYWNGWQFTAPFGRKIYLSPSDKNLDIFSEEDRSMLSVNYTRKERIADDIHFALQGEAYYDFLNSEFSFGFGFYLLINQDFILKRF